MVILVLLGSGEFRNIKARLLLMNSVAEFDLLGQFVVDVTVPSTVKSS